MAATLQHCINKCTVLQKPTEKIQEYFEQYPKLYKSALIINHLFRAISMAAFRLFLPCAPLVSMGLCFASSLFYRLTVETHCAYKFALPAFAGSLALPIAQEAFMHLISGVAFASLHAFAVTSLSFVPIAAYLTYITLSVSYEVDRRLS